MSAKIKREDPVVVTSGKYKGNSGQVKACLSNGYLIVSGIALVKKCIKPNPDKGIEGGIIEKESPIHVSNVAFLVKSLNKSSRIGFKILENGKKVRYAKLNNEVIDL